MKHFSRRRVIGVSLMLLGIIFFVIGFFCESYNKKPLDYVVLNVNEEINLDIFFDYDYKNANFITDVLDIDTSKLGVYDVEISLNERIFLSKLEIVDVEAPIVDVKDLKLSFYSELTPDMFIEKIEDDTECSVKFEKDFVKKDGLQNVTIIVEDSAGNVTRKIATLDLAKVKEEVVIEAGSSFDVNSVIYGAEFVEDLKIIKNINVNKLGEQDLVININGEELIVKVIVKDTKAPVVTKKDVTIWWDQKIGSIDSFIRNVTDVTEVKKEYLTNINYSKIGTQTVKIRVTDTSGNYVDLDVKLTIKKDTKAPSINNLSKLVITRGSKPNYTKNVKAVDDHDGNLSFTYDDSSVDYNNVGTYYVVYKAVDKSGNKKTSKREVVVMGNRKDVEEKLRPIVSSITSSSKSESQNALAIRNWVAQNISYANSDLREITPSAWEGITKRKGDCYTHFAITKIMLDIAGIKNMEIHLISKGHYWNLVYVDGVWRHMDSTPGVKITTLMTDKEYEKYVLSGWDRSKYPEAK